MRQPSVFLQLNSGFVYPQFHAGRLGLLPQNISAEADDDDNQRADDHVKNIPFHVAENPNPEQKAGLYQIFS